MYKITATSNAYSCEILLQEKKVLPELKRIRRLFESTAKIKTYKIYDRRRQKYTYVKERTQNGDRLFVKIEKLN